MNIFVCLSLLLLTVSASASVYKKCGNPKGEVTSVEVSGCPDSATRCTLTKGTTAEIAINFVAKEDASSVTAVVHGVILGMAIPFKIPQPDGCKSGLSCPLKNGQSYTYKNGLEVKNSYPPIPVTVRYELQDQNGDDIVCVEIPSHIH